MKSTAMGNHWTRWRRFFAVQGLQLLNWPPRCVVLGDTSDKFHNNWSTIEKDDLLVLVAAFVDALHPLHFKAVPETKALGSQPYVHVLILG